MSSDSKYHWFIMKKKQIILFIINDKHFTTSATGAAKGSLHAIMMKIVEWGGCGEEEEEKTETRDGSKWGGKIFRR